MTATPPHFDLSGKTAVVTGSSSGIGRAIALMLARAGSAVVVHARASETAANAVAGDIQRLGSAAKVILAEIADENDRDRFIDEAWSWRDGVEIWINNAGADVLTGEAAQWSFEQKLEKLWQVDAAGTMHLSRAIGARMRDRNPRPASAAILNMGWDQAEQGMAGDSGEMFAAVKGAVMAFSCSLAQSLAPQVRVNCLAPGWIRTAWSDQASEYWQQRACDESLMGRWGTADDVAQAALYLVSPAADFITGQVIAINGGFRYSR